MSEIPQRVFLTGFSEGIGGATCRLLAQRAAAEGCKLKLVGTASGSKPEPKTLIQELKEAGADVLYLTGDISDAAVARSLAERAVEFCGGLDLFVANAGGVSPGRLSDIDVSIWDRQFALNVRATLVMAQVLHGALKASKGSAVAVASMSGMQAHLGQAAYSPAKAALISLVRNLAQEWAVDGIRVNAVSPGMIHTPLTDRVYADEAITKARQEMVPLGRIGRPEDIAAIIVFLGGIGADYITGQTILAGGGLSDSILGRIPGLTRVKAE